ncbi:MAG TPA: hypothetical protein VFZ04_08535 [Longimicrobiales bacterium]
MYRNSTAAGLFVLLLAGVAQRSEAQVTRAIQVPLTTETGWGPIQPQEGFKALRIQGRTTADPRALARLFADFAAHPSMFPRVVDRVDVLACDSSSLKARYRTKFDPKPGGKTTVESLSAVKVFVTADRVEFTWSSDQVESKFVNAVRGRMLFVAQRTASGSETLVDYVSSVRPRNSAKGLLMETQKSILVSDARYVIDRLMELAVQHGSADHNAGMAGPVFNCARIRN